MRKVGTFHTKRLVIPVGQILPGPRPAFLSGLAGSLLGIAADTASLYAVGRAESLRAAQPLVSLKHLTPYLLEKPEWQLLLGHFLILVAVPLMMAGLLPLYELFARASGPAAVIFGGAGVVGLVSGAVLHGGFPYVVTLLQVTRGRPGSILLGKYAGYLQIPAFAALVCMVLSFGLLMVYTLMGGIDLPRWSVFANPLIVFPATTAIGYLVPLQLGVYLIIISPNVSLFVLYSVCLGVVETTGGPNSRLPGNRVRTGTQG